MLLTEGANMRKLSIAILFVTFAFESWAEQAPYLVTEQFVAAPWFRYIKSDTLTITAKNRMQKVKYCFAVKGATDSDATIDCKIAFPNDIDVDFLSCSGILKIGTTGKKSILMETSYVEGENRYFEFLIPQKGNVKGFVELSLTIPYYYKNKNIPVEALPFKLIADTSTVSEVDSASEAHNTVQNKLSQLKISCAQMPLDSSATRFNLYVK